MAGDYTRFTFDPRRRYSGVWMQQGRVQLDADWNEAVEIAKRGVRTLALDTFGRVGLPVATTPDAFLIGLIAGPPADLSIGAGRLYVDGIAAEIFPGEPVTYLTQPFLPDPPALPAGDAAVYLDVWEREITYIEAPAILDVALGGADTATRTQVVWQVRFAEVRAARCGIDVGDPPSAGRLTTEAVAPPAPDDPCILPPASGYRGLENRLYRVEIHNGGAIGTARFKWSRDNGSIVSAVTGIAVAGGQTTLTVNRIGRDPVLRLRIDDWVTLTDDHRELMGEPGEMARIVDINEAMSQVVLDRAVPTAGGRAFGANVAEVAERHTRVQRWDQSAALNTVDADGLMATAAGPIPLEDGIQIRFDADPVGGAMRVGDYWVFAARTADASVEILDQAPPRGIIHHYAQLAAITGLGGENPNVDDCRPRPEAREGCCCCLVTVGAREDAAADFTSLAGAVAALGQLAPDPSVPVIVCLLAGDHPVPAPVRIARPRVTVRGCGWGTRLLPQQGPALILEAEEQAVEDLAILAEHREPLIDVLGAQKRIEACRLENQGPGPAVRATRVRDLLIRDNIVAAGGGLDLAGRLIEVAGNRILGGPVLVAPPSRDVRIHDNELLNARDDAIVLGGRAVIYDVEIVRNRIQRADRHGIVSGFFDPEDQGNDGIIAGLLIDGNEISECGRGRASESTADVPLAAIALGRVYDLSVRDNRIERNGEAASGAVCPIYVRHSRGVEISRNVIRNNGRRPDGQTFSGPQAGISLRDARISFVEMPDPGDAERFVRDLEVMPAARVADNLVESRRGPALYILGQGPMTVEGNRFEANDILGDLRDQTTGTFDQFVGTVFLFNTGLPAYLAGLLGSVGVSALANGSLTHIQGSPILTALIVGGQTQYRGNQARLDLARIEGEVVLANVAIVTLDDAVIAGNQTEGVLSLRFRQQETAAGLTLSQGLQADVMFADLLAFGLTIRQSHNGLMSTPFLTIFSILSFGFLNHCIDNQCTSCVLAVGTSPKSVVRDNAVIFPNPRFCPEDPD